ncbi:3-dehydroquinate synthase [Flavobacteriaceae bacterium]|nr:3-dehydroquinate synthase [Flavobacteriaceae bacterium]
MQTIQSTSYPVHFKDNAYKELNAHLIQNQYSRIFLFVDSNTNEYCAPLFLGLLETHIPIEIIEIVPGESEKNIETVVAVWQSLTELGADRKSLMINLGGGVLTDMGGFISSTFKRGIDFINIPTTLLSMVDASVGGKTGIDLGVLKNQIGLFSDPQMVLIDPSYLGTLSEREMTSGLAEIIKYGLTFDINLWESFKNPKGINVNDLIHQSIAIKNYVVLEDPKEVNLRKVLNYGHTLGHAIESYYLESKHLERLTHGEAIAIGMIAEAYLSKEICGLDQYSLDEIKKVILNVFGQIEVSRSDYDGIFEYLKHDKKNVGGEVNFVLLQEICKFKLDQKASVQQMIEALDFYNL